MAKVCIFRIILLIFLFPSYLLAQRGLEYDSQVFDFGHVGIDFKLFHTYKLVNVTDKPIKITELKVPCDCSMVTMSDSIVEPGDTVFLNLTFSTKDLYGPTSKSFKILTDDPNTPEIQFFNLSIVGQWFNGIKPNVISLFFLPGKKSQKVTITNYSFKNIRLSNLDIFDTTFTVNIIKEVARKGEMLEMEFFPNQHLKKGAFQSNITFNVITDDNDPTILTIPVKIVRY